MEEAVKLSPRFLRRLMTFFHPFTHRFSDIERNKVSTKETTHVICTDYPWQANMRWVKLGCTLLTTLLASSDGQRFLSSDDDLLKQLTRSFAQLDPVRPCFHDIFLCLTNWLIVQWRPRVRPNFLKKAGF